MKLLIISILSLWCATNTNAGKHSMVAIDLNGFEKTFLSYVGTMGPVYNQTYTNVMDKLTELEFLGGVQPVFILATLYSQFLPSFLICKQQLKEQTKSFPAIIKSTQPNGENVLFTSKQFKTFNAAQQMLINGDSVAIAGMLAQINAIGTLVNSDDFTYTHKTFTAPTADIQAFIDSQKGFVAGNKKLVTGLKMIESMNSTAVMAQQTNPYSEYFVGAMFNYFSQSLPVYQQMVILLQNSINNFEKLLDNSAPSSTVQIKSIVQGVVKVATKLANDYFSISTFDFGFESEILHPPPISVSSTKST